MLVACRAGWSASFALLLVVRGGERPSGVFGYLTRFLAVDGVLLVLIAIALFVALRGLSVWIIPAFDGLVRIALGQIVQANPGIPDFPVSAVVYLTFVGLLFLLDGIGDVFIAIRWREALGRRMAHVIFIAAGSAIALVATAIITSARFDVIRAWLAVAAATQALMLITAAFEYVRVR
jgi:hypothetical protein